MSAYYPPSSSGGPSYDQQSHQTQPYQQQTYYAQPGVPQTTVNNRGSKSDAASILILITLIVNACMVLWIAVNAEKTFLKVEAFYQLLQCQIYESNNFATDPLACELWNR